MADLLAEFMEDIVDIVDVTAEGTAPPLSVDPSDPPLVVEDYDLPPSPTKASKESEPTNK